MDFDKLIQKKIISIETLVHRITMWRFFEKKIVFTNGCFDLLHPGHIHLLNTARSLGDILIVGLNSDVSVSKIKPGRPVQEEQARAILIASLEVVDAVTLFPEETPQNIIEKILPDILVKGSDYKLEDVIGRKTVEEHGGKVELVPLQKGFSTSALMEKVRSGMK